MKNIFKSRIWLVALGIGLGLLARATLGVPDNSDALPRTLHGELGPAPETEIDSHFDLKKTEGSESGLVPPIRVPSIEAASGVLDREQYLTSVRHAFDKFDHDPGAEFHAHGEQVCGVRMCGQSAIQRKNLAKTTLTSCLPSLPLSPYQKRAWALEKLLYYGPQTRKLIEKSGFGPLDTDRATFLWEELDRTHAKISLRVIDESGKIRTWLEPTLVPFDRRHVFKMETENLQPLVTSGTVKRVGAQSYVGPVVTGGRALCCRTVVHGSKKTKMNGRSWKISGSVTAKTIVAGISKSKLNSKGTNHEQTKWNFVPSRTTSRRWGSRTSDRFR